MKYPTALSKEWYIAKNLNYQKLNWKHENVNKFVNYLKQHRSRIVNYADFQTKGITIGSGGIESTVKQIGRRIKLSGAQWSSNNIAQVLLHRCAYLNGYFSVKTMI